ncbi:MAG: universal stress protein [Polyangiaceae bacterium]|nr:universal stress protein [Polyangiaceae bacterium]MCW5789372.1 universal stress protein [Polyangiaceae bacterium]
MKPLLLCPIDFSSASEFAFERTLALAQVLDCAVQVLHVYEPAELRPDPGFFLYAGNLRPLRDIVRDQAERSLAEFAEAHATTEVEVSYRAVEGRAAEAIVEEAGKGNYRMVVMATRGRTGLAHLLLGSVAERVVRLSPVPVLTIKAERG